MWFNKMPWCQDLDTDMLKCDQKEASVIHGGGLSSEPCGTYFWNYISKERRCIQESCWQTSCFTWTWNVISSSLESIPQLSGSKLQMLLSDWKGEMERYFCPRGTPMTSICLAAYLETTENLWQRSWHLSTSHRECANVWDRWHWSCCV